MELILIIALLFLNTPFYKLLFRVFFTSIDDFKETIKLLLTPDIFSLFKGKYLEDTLGEFRLGLFLISCILINVVEYFSLQYLLDLF